MGHAEDPAAAYLRLLPQHAPVGLVATDDRWRIIACNPAVAAITGYDRPELEGLSLGSLMTRGSAMVLQTRFPPELIATGAVDEVALDVLHREGHRIPVLLSSRTTCDPALDRVAAVTAITPAAIRRGHERDLMAARRRAEASERQLARLHGVTRRLAVAWSEAQVEEALASHRVGVAADGDAGPAEQDAVDLAAEQARGRIALLARLEGEARTDPLTGLANRRGLDEVPRRMQTDAVEGPLTLLFADLDDFKGVNDRHGHLTGDRVLVSVARTLEDAVPRGDVVARVGGDEFVVLTRRPATSAEAEQLRADVDARLHQVTAPCGSGASIGVVHARSEAGTTSLDSLVAEADAAMYVNKRRGRVRGHDRRG